VKRLVLCVFLFFAAVVDTASIAQAAGIFRWVEVDVALQPDYKAAVTYSVCLRSTGNLHGPRILFRGGRGDPRFRYGQRPGLVRQQPAEHTTFYQTDERQEMGRCACRRTSYRFGRRDLQIQLRSRSGTVGTSGNHSIRVRGARILQLGAGPMGFVARTLHRPRDLSYRGGSRRVVHGADGQLQIQDRAVHEPRLSHLLLRPGTRESQLARGAAAPGQ